MFYLNVLNSKEKELLKLIGFVIRKIRTQRKLTQAQMAFELGTSTKQYQRVEYGEVNTRIINLSRISEVLDVKLEEIIKLCEKS